MEGIFSFLTNVGKNLKIVKPPPHMPAEFSRLPDNTSHISAQSDYQLLQI